nr:peptidoglycan-binding domain-containing protein [Bradyrhizobium sp. 139]
MTGEADGVLGTRTREALITFQRQQGIQASGSIDTRTVSTLGGSNKISATQARSRLVKDRRTSSRRNRARPDRTLVRPTLRRTEQPTTGQVQQNQPATTGQGGTQQPSGQTTGQSAPPAQGNNPPAATRICRPGSPTRAILRHRASRPTILKARSIEERDAEPRFGGAHFAPRYSGALQIPAGQSRQYDRPRPQPKLSVAKRPFE